MADDAGYKVLVMLRGNSCKYPSLHFFGGQNYNYFKCNFTFVNLCKIARQKKATGAGKVTTPSSGVILRTVLIPLH